MTISKVEILAFVDMPTQDWRMLTVAMGTLYRTQRTKPDHRSEVAEQYFPAGVPSEKEWLEIRTLVSKVRKKVMLTRQIASGLHEQTKERRRAYMRKYMRERRKSLAKALETPTLGASHELPDS
jgi:hypothetical protein